MKSYVRKKKVSGAWREDQNGCFTIFETLSRMWKLAHNEMPEAVPVMLHEGDLLTYSDKSGDCAT